MLESISFNEKLVLLVLISVLLFQILLIPTLAEKFNQNNLMPNWFKTNVSWWQEDKITENEIINAMEFLLHKEIIKIDSKKIKYTITTNSKISQLTDEEHKKIIANLKQKLGFWKDGSVSELMIINVVIQLVEKNIIDSTDYKQTKLSAAIIDVLDDSNPNRPAQQKIQQFLEKAGYNVDIFTTKDATVDFYKRLPLMNYNFIYIRTHSLVVQELNNTTFLFTGENYNINKYFSEQLSGQIAKGYPFYVNDSSELEKNKESFNKEMYFMVSSKFVVETMQGVFPHSIIVIGGCESVKNLDIAQSLVLRGASSIIGWTNPILVGENDRAMLTLFEEMLINKSDINDSINIVMEKYGSYLHYDSALRYIHPLD